MIDQLIDWLLRLLERAGFALYLWAFAQPDRAWDKED